MGLPNRRFVGRTHLHVEQLEDRTVPATLLNPNTTALAAAVANGEILGDRINVVMTNTAPSAADQALLASAPFAAEVKSIGFGIYNVTLTAGTELATALEYYNGLSGVASAAPDEIIRVAQTPNDPRYTSNELYGINKISAPTAWDTTTGDRNFVVAVIDTGTDYRHPDLRTNMYINQAEIPTANKAEIIRQLDLAANAIISYRELNDARLVRGANTIRDTNSDNVIDGTDVLATVANGGWADGADNGTNGFVDDLIGWDFFNNSNNPFRASDGDEHGTHVSGTIGAVGNNGVGVVGVNWDVSILPLKFLGPSGGSTSGAIQAVNYAVNNGVKLSNNSWGGGGFSQTLADAIGRAKNFGHIFVAAAGNSSRNIDNTPSYPASYISLHNNIVNVAATDSADRLAGFSNFGVNSVTLAAPGVGILSTTPNNNYANFNGTSMAAPHVAGAIALYWSANPTLTYTQVIDKLTSSVDVVAGLATTVQTGGRLNVARMFEGGGGGPGGGGVAPKVLSAVYNGTPNVNFTSVRVTFDRAIDAGSFTLTDISTFFGPGGSIIIPTAVTVVGGTGSTQFDVTFAPQTAVGTYTMTFGPNITNGGVQMDQNGNGTPGEAADAFNAVGQLVFTGSRTYTASNLNLAIRDFTTTTSTITVLDNMSISDLNVRITLSHTYVSDLSITLTSPTGQTITLFSRHGGSGDNLSNTGFNDEASISIASGRAPFTGDFRPVQSLTAFDGRNAQGTWTLRVRDNATRDIGTLQSWSLVVTGSIGGAGSLQVLGFRSDEFADTAAPLAVDAARAVQTIVTGPSAAAGRVFGVLDSADDELAFAEEFDADTETAADRAERPVQFAAPVNEPVGSDDDDFEAVLALLTGTAGDEATELAFAEEV